MKKITYSRETLTVVAAANRDFFMTICAAFGGGMEFIMQENPIPAIENAELTARRTIQKANDDKVSLLREARERANKDFDRALQKAQADSDSILQAARQVSETALAALDARFELEKADIIRRAAGNENTAINAVIGIISGKTS